MEKTKHQQELQSQMYRTAFEVCQGLINSIDLGSSTYDDGMHIVIVTTMTLQGRCIGSTKVLIPKGDI